jgi:hypothetical protein
MKNIILCSSFYNDIDSLSELTANLEYTDCLYGREIEEFHYIPAELTEMISAVLEKSVEIQPDTGVFRKPNSIVHFDNFYEHALWTCVVALEDTAIHIHEHKDGSKSYFDMPKEDEQFFINNCMTADKWTTTVSINIKKNDYVFVRPWLWKSFEQDKTIQVFMVNNLLKSIE